MIVCIDNSSSKLSLPELRATTYSSSRLKGVGLALGPRYPSLRNKEPLMECSYGQTSLLFCHGCFCYVLKEGEEGSVRGECEMGRLGGETGARVWGLWADKRYRSHCLWQKELNAKEECLTGVASDKVSARGCASANVRMGIDTLYRSLVVSTAS